MLDDTAPEDGGFKIEVNGKPITYADRQDLKTLEFIWEFGTETLRLGASHEDQALRVAWRYRRQARLEGERLDRHRPPNDRKT